LTLLQPALDAFQHQQHLQRGWQVVDAPAGRRGIEALRDGLPRVELQPFLRNAIEEIAHVGERRQPQKFLAIIYDAERPGQRA